MPHSHHEVGLVSARPESPTDFDDLLTANRSYAATFALGGFDGVAHAGVLVFTCMDSRIDPLGMLGLEPGDAKIVRNAGARLTDAALEAMVLGVHLLEVERILIIPHTRCAVASSTEQEIVARTTAASGQDTSQFGFHVITDQLAALRRDARTLREHPLIPSDILIGGFLYDVDTGLLTQVV
ncbi:carbonic anhydrase [Lapillicoccus sp.]|uniref:beta-class carbonic anhydrase n=1 Tax=Lapillicoccus sp. TaxID=1909287 RepID=UPI0025F21C29|nr:carbonic anhydrase [Lapillicoccus sp.]